MQFTRIIIKMMEKSNNAITHNMQQRHHSVWKQTSIAIDGIYVYVCCKLRMGSISMHSQKKPHVLH